MSRSTRAVVSVLLLGGFAAVPAAPIPADARKPLYFPVTKGTRWTYERHDARKMEVEEVFEVVTQVEEEDGVTRVTIEAEDPVFKRRVLRQVMAVSPRRLDILTTGDITLPTPHTVLDLTRRPGAGWAIETNFGVLPLVGKGWVRGVESVEVPAGKFHAVRVECEFIVTIPSSTARRPDRHESFRGTRWFAAGVGEVKTAWSSGEGRVLKTFTPAKP